eukprot:TRINITY_DN7163_c0_g1_i8.p1 TRINITY_DN7163_c0_g1~~TRINITY_DN7163_c0_g1_i8.p1  ORF type:complete len:126 (-),score=27.07 TRINITY_DN7163_c0_g1_i8:207-584(-)
MVLEGQQVSLISTVSGLTMGSTSINFSNIDQKELGSLVSQPARQSSNRWMEIQYPSELWSDHAYAHKDVVRVIVLQTTILDPVESPVETEDHEQEANVQLNCHSPLQFAQLPMSEQKHVEKQVME